MDEVTDDVLILHEDILDENEEDVKDLLKTLKHEKVSLLDVVSKEVRLENDPNWGMSAIHRAAAVGNTSILSLLLQAAPEVDINAGVSHQGLTALHLAAAEGHTPMVNYLASNGAVVNAVDTLGRTALHLAADEGHRDVAQILGVKSANCTVKDHRGLTPLHLAASKNHCKMVNYLVKKPDAEIEAKDDLGQTALHKAMTAAAFEVSEVLISQEADINSKDKNGNTPLHLVIQGFTNHGRNSPNQAHSLAEVTGQEMARKFIIEAAIKQGADINMQNNDGDTPLHNAIAADVLDVAKALLDRKAKVNALNRRGCSPLFFSRNNMAVRLLAENGAAIMARDNWKNTALHVFAGDNDIYSDVLDAMMELGSDINGRNVEERTALYNACESGHMEKVKKLLDYNATYNISDRSKKSLLHACLEAGRDDVAYFLVDRVGVTVQSSDDNGTFPLHLAVMNANYALTDLLIKKGATVNVSDRRTCTPASLAILHGHYDLLRLLIQNGAKVDDNTAGSEAPLNLFAKCDDVINVCRLLDQGLDINRPDDHGRTALHDAVAARAYTVAKELLSRGARADTSDKSGESPLHRAGYVCDEPDLYISLIKSGAKINQKNMNDETPLHIALRNNRSKHVLATLVDSGADILAIDKVGSCPLHCAVSESNDDYQCYDNLMCLLSHDSGQQVDLNVRNLEGKTPLHVAARRCFPKACRLLLQNEASIDLQDDEGRTALHYSSMLGRPDVANVLVKAKAMVDVLDNHGASPLIYAVRSGALETVELLLGQGADCGLVANGSPYPLHEALSSSNSDLVELFLMNEVDVTHVDNKRRTALHLAAASAPSGVVETMLTMDADVSATDTHGNTPLHLAMKNKEVSVARLLIKHGANKIINAVNKDGNTALHLSCLYGSYEHVNLLLETGADFTMRNSEGQTALHLAAKSFDQDALELLVSNDADINITDEKGSTPLLIALSHDNKDAAITLIEQGADVHQVDSLGQGPLHKVALMSDPTSSLISLLYKRGLSPYLRDLEDKTPLQLANDNTLQLLTKLRLE